MQGILQHVARTSFATAGAGADAELLAQLSQTGVAFGDRLEDILFSQRAATATVTQEKTAMPVLPAPVPPEDELH